MRPQESGCPAISIVGVTVAIGLAIFQYRTGHYITFGILLAAAGGYLEQFFARLRYRFGGFHSNGHE